MSVRVTWRTTTARGLLRRPRAGAIAKYAMVAPALALFLVFYVAAVVFGLFLSLYSWNGLEPRRFVGFDNYDRLFSDPVFGTNVKVTLLVVAVCVVTVLPLALLLAVCLSGKGRLLPLFRSILFLPVVVPLAATALLWAEFFSPNDNGVVNSMIALVGIDPIAWLGDTRAAPWALILVSIWTLVGVHVVIQLSGLSAIPTELKEAARLETTSSLRVFLHVILPLLRDTLTVSVALIVTGTFVFFTGLALIMTLGGPVHATEVLGLRAYVEGFSALNFGLASAVTVVTMVITIVLVGATLLLGSRRRVEF
jgi:ABC-type sugar transport system permease subunit